MHRFKAGDKVRIFFRWEPELHWAIIKWKEDGVYFEEMRNIDYRAGDLFKRMIRDTVLLRSFLNPSWDYEILIDKRFEEHKQRMLNA